jgi:hypothetical protein
LGLLELELVKFLVPEIRHFAFSQATWLRELFEKILKNLSHFQEEESYKIAKK